MNRALEDDVPYKMHLLKRTKFTNAQPRRVDEDQICTVDEHYKHEVLDSGFNFVNGVRRLSVEGTSNSAQRTRAHWISDLQDTLTST